MEGILKMPSIYTLQKKIKEPPAIAQPIIQLRKLKENYKRVYQSDDSPNFRTMKRVNDFQEYMEICEQLAIKAGEKENARVGCIILKGNQIIARAEEAGRIKQDVTCHAEIEAIRKARKKIGIDMSECTLVTTHEPCIMCGYVIRFHKIGKVVFKNRVDYLGSVSSTMKVLSTSEVPNHWGQPPTIIHFKN